MINQGMLPIIFAGLLAAIALAGISQTTIAPTPIMLLAPILTPFKIKAPVPIKTLSAIFTGLAAIS